MIAGQGLFSGDAGMTRRMTLKWHCQDLDGGNRKDTISRQTRICKAAVANASAY